MFDDYNRYFKGNPMFAPYFDTGGSIRATQSPSAGKGLALLGVRVDARPDTISKRRPKKQQRVVRPDTRSTSGETGSGASPATPYILSIMALPKPEHETCVEPGMSRAKS
jgi:hypothetical protein